MNRPAVSHPHPSHSATRAKIGLVLSGGGARGAYQAGVLKAIAEIRAATPEAAPIPVVTGVSAGAINASYVAAMAHDASAGADKLVDMWRSLNSGNVFKTDAFSLGRIGLKWATDATLGAFYPRKLARALLDTSPLHRLLQEQLPFNQISRNIATSAIEALAVTAMNYSSAHSLTFVQGPPHLEMWSRARRRSEFAQIGVDHVMASAAIPIFFPPVRVGAHHYGDGCLRNTAPLSPAIHLGADKLIVIGVRRPDAKAAPVETEIEPSIARILGVVLNALLLDAIEMDMERLSRINSTLGFIPDATRRELALRKVDFLWIRPSEDIGAKAVAHFEHLPQVLRYLMRGLGTSKEASELTSYLLFHPDYNGQLIDLGYRDGLAHRDEITRFFAPEIQQATG